MQIRDLIQKLLVPWGLEIRRIQDPSLPMLHQLSCDGVTRKFWLTNAFTKSWWMKPEIRLNGELTEIKRLCSPGYCVLEIGAHHGMMTLLISHLVGEHGEVHAIEASADNALVLEANLFRNSISNVRVEFVAMGATPGTARFGGESLAAASGVVREIAMTTLDSYCKSNACQKIDLLKIDVEGFELDVLRGATELLRTAPQLALELHNDLLPSAGASSKQVWQLLESAGMFVNRKISMVSRPNWDQITPVNCFEDIPTSGVVNLFVG